MLATRLKGASASSGLVYVGGYVTQFAGTTSTTSVTLTSLTGGVASAPGIGDLVIVGYGISAPDDRDVTISTAGYTEVYDLNAIDSYDTNLGVFFKIMGGTPDTSVVLGQTYSTANNASVYVSVWRNANSTWPLKSSASSTASNSMLANPPSIAATGSVNAVVAIGSGAANSINVNYSSSDLTNFLSARQSGNNGSIIGGGYKNPVSGTFDPAAFTGPTDSTSASWAAASLEIREQNQNTPTFISSSSFVDNETSASVTPPSGIQNGDILIAVGFLNNNNTVSLPSGFTSVASLSNTDGSTRVGYKIASNESGNYSFGYGTDSNNQSIILLYRNATYSTVSSISRTTSGDSSTASAMTNPNVGINLYFFYTSSITTVDVAPSGTLNTRYSNSTGCSVVIYDENAAIPISGAKTLLWNNGGIMLGFQLNITG